MAIDGIKHRAKTYRVTTLKYGTYLYQVQTRDWIENKNSKPVIRYPDLQAAEREALRLNMLNPNLFAFVE